MAYPIISADSHVTEPPNTYTEFIDRAFLDRAPRMEKIGDAGDMFVIDGMSEPISIGLAAAAAGRPKRFACAAGASRTCTAAAGIRRRAWPTRQRDGVAAEVIYPTVGMVLCNHSDLDYKKACFDAYNLWIARLPSAHPERLLGIGQTAMRTARRGHRRPARDQAAGAPRRDDARRPRLSRTTTRRSTTSSGKRPWSSSYRSRSTS